MQGPSRNRTLFFILIISLLANIVMLAYFGWIRESFHHGPRNWPNSPISVFLKKDIGFTDQQMEAYNKLRLQNRQKMKPLFEEVRQAKVGFYEHLDDQQVNDSLLDAAAAQVGEKQKALDLQTLKNFRQLRDLCTEDQKRRYDSLITGVINNMWFSPRNGPPPGKKR